MTKKDNEENPEASTDFADFEKHAMADPKDDAPSDDEDHDDADEGDDTDDDDQDDDDSDADDDSGDGDDDDAEEDDEEPEGEDEEGTDENDPEDEDQGAEDEEGQDDEEAQKGKKKKKSVQQRIAELTKKRREAERTAAEATAKLAEAEARNKELTATQEKAEAPAPDPNDEKYRYGEVDELYLEDVAEYKANKLFANKQAEEEKVKAEKTAADRTAYFEGKMKNLETEGVTKYDDFEDTLASIESGEVPLTFTMAELMLESKHGADVVHALASDPAEATRISQLTPLRQAAEFGKLEAQFSKTPAKSSAKKGRKKSKAPTPPRRRSRGKGGKFAPDGSTTDFAAFEKLANSQD